MQFELDLHVFVYVLKHFYALTLHPAINVRQTSVWFTQLFLFLAFLLPMWIFSAPPRLISPLSIRFPFFQLIQPVLLLKDLAAL